VDHGIRSDSFRLGLIREEDSVAEDFGSEILDVGWSHESPLLQEGPSPGCESEVDGGSGGGS
jgi:hypothetical protein